MLRVRKAGARGIGEHGWLSSRHTFSFAGYHDPEFMGFRALRVINEDRVAPGKGFGTHPHRDMEIISYVISGALEHKDSLGTGSVLRPGEIQRMTAGTGITHSEFNPSLVEPVHFLQIWITPSEQNLTPSYEQVDVQNRLTSGRLHLIASPNGGENIVTVHQDVMLYAGVFEGGESACFQRLADRHVWLHLVRGQLTVNGAVLSAGDGAFTSDIQILDMKAGSSAEVLLFDLA